MLVAISLMHIYVHMQDGWTPMLFSSEKGNIIIVKALLERGASISDVDVVRSSFIH